MTERQGGKRLMDLTCFKQKVIYQIYPKSFKDSNNDGIGDIPGIIEKLPYLQQLGIDMIWLNPVYPSPQHDNGYDVSAYRAIDPLFGTMDDFEDLVREAKARGIEIMLDMVFNHVSTSHEWFQRALAGEKRYQDYFIIRDTPTDWRSKFGGDAWAPFDGTGRYYLHLFDPTQADLDWRNPQVREELFEVVRFWMGKGVTGFRFDVINVIGKDKVLKSNDHNEGKPEYTDKPINHGYLLELNRKTYGQDQKIITVGEMSSTSIDNCVLYTNPQRQELTMAFNFHHLKVDYANGHKWTSAPYNFEELKNILHVWGEKMCEGDGWSALFWNNHDQPRALSRFIQGSDFREQGAMMLAAAIHLSRGTPYIYMGEEIGMVNPNFKSITQYVDVETKNAYRMLMEQGLSEQQALRIIQNKSRDNARIPMQWDTGTYAGFSDSEPWIGVGHGADTINVEQELKHGKIFRFYQRLIQIRKKHRVVSRGSYQARYWEHPMVYGFYRQYGEEELLVVNNFFPRPTAVDLPQEFLEAKTLISNNSIQVDLSATLQLKLEPYQTVGLLR